MAIEQMEAEQTRIATAAAGRQKQTAAVVGVSGEVTGAASIAHGASLPRPGAGTAVTAPPPPCSAAPTSNPKIVVGLSRNALVYTMQDRGGVVAAGCVCTVCGRRTVPNSVGGSSCAGGGGAVDSKMTKIPPLPPFHNDVDEEELGELIYKSSHTAKARAAGPLPAATPLYDPKRSTSNNVDVQIERQKMLQQMEPIPVVGSTKDDAKKEHQTTWQDIDRTVSLAALERSIAGKTRLSTLERVQKFRAKMKSTPEGLADMRAKARLYKKRSRRKKKIKLLEEERARMVRALLPAEREDVGGWAARWRSRLLGRMRGDDAGRALTRDERDELDLKVLEFEVKAMRRDKASEEVTQCVADGSKGAALPIDSREIGCVLPEAVRSSADGNGNVWV